SPTSRSSRPADESRPGGEGRALRIAAWQTLPLGKHCRLANEVGVLLSMTGYGEARFQSEQLTLSIELRALNNRYLKVTVRAPDPYHLLEPEFEKVIRRTVKRGTLQV